MIYDTLKTLELYAPACPALSQIATFIKAHDLNELPVGRYELDGDNLYILVQTPTLKPAGEGAWECHRQYADVQIGVLPGETVAWALTNEVMDWSAYAPDACLSSDPLGGLSIPLLPGRFLLLLPGDAHKPGLGKGVTKKIVAKIRL